MTTYLTIPDLVHIQRFFGYLLPSAAFGGNFPMKKPENAGRNLMASQYKTWIGSTDGESGTRNVCLTPLGITSNAKSVPKVDLSFSNNGAVPKIVS